MFHCTKIFFNNNAETEYVSCGTYLCLLFHIVNFDIKALVVPWHQFEYTYPLHTMWSPGNSTNILRVFIICEVLTSKVLLHF